MKHFLSTASLLTTLLALILSLEVYAQAPSPAVGDYGSVASGNWSDTTTTWRLWDGTGWNTVPTTTPGGGTNVFILSGTTVTYDIGSTYNQNCRDLIVQANAEFKSDQILPQQNGSLAVLKVEGDTLWINGNLGGGANDGLTIETKTSTSPYTITLCGSGGSVNLASVRPNSHQKDTPVFVFARNANINYAGTDSTGGAGIYSQRGSPSTVTFTVNAGDTVNFAAHSGIAINPTFGNNGNVTTTFNINGVVNDSGTVALTDTGTAAAMLNIGSTGKLIVRGGSIVQSLNGADTAAVSVNGTYEHAMDGGVIPAATWNIGSNCLITGTKTLGPTGANQNFYNFTVKCDSLTLPSYPCHFDMANNTIAGSLTFESTNSINPATQTYYALTGYEVTGSPKTITINGNLVVDSISSLAIDDFASSHGTESVTVIVKGNLDIAYSGYLSLRAGSAKTLNNLEILGNVNLQTGSSLYSHSSSTDSLIFAGTGIQTYTTGTLSNNNNISNCIRSGATVYMDTSIFTGSSSSFTLQPGGTIATGHSLGLNGNITTGGSRTLSNSANYIYNGSAAQVTGSFLPDSIANLTINNATGVILSQSTTINDTLFLTAGLFDNTIPFIQGSNFKIVTGKGSTKDPITGVDNLKLQPLTFKVEQNYPNPFNPSTTINFSLKSADVVSIKIYNILGSEVRTLINEEKPSGNYSVQWDGRDNSGLSVASGAYFYRYSAGNVTQIKKMILLK